MPELPEVEITARLLDAALAARGSSLRAGAGDQRAEDVRPAAVGARGRGRIAAVRRRGKHLIVDVDGGGEIRPGWRC